MNTARTDYGPSLRDMVAEVREVNTALGWRTDRNSFGNYIALLHNEIGKATQAYRKHRTADATRPVCGRAANGEEPCPEHGPSKPEGVGSELADVLIRQLDTCDDLDFHVWDLDMALADVPPFDKALIAVTHELNTFGDWMAWLHRHVGKFHDSTDGAPLLRALVTVAEQFGIDLTAEYQRKIAYNRTREWQHGGTLSGVTPTQ